MAYVRLSRLSYLSLDSLSDSSEWNERIVLDVAKVVSGRELSSELESENPSDEDVFLAEDGVSVTLGLSQLVLSGFHTRKLHGCSNLVNSFLDGIMQATFLRPIDEKIRTGMR